MSTRNDYLGFIQSAYERENGRLDAEIEAWRGRFRANLAANALLGYMPPRWPLHLAVVTAFLYEQTGRPALAEQARSTLLRFRAWTELMPPEAVAERPEYAGGVPPLDCCFDPLIFATACERIRPAVSAADYAAFAEMAADSLRPIWRFPEWGGHNRAALRAASLAACAHAFPDHPEAPAWTGLADELAEESWGRWSIEDAMMYQSHWLRALILYAEARGKPEIAEFVQPRLYLRAMTQLISPIGVLPDFGDSHWLMDSPWEWLACLEWGGRAYRDGAMRWAAGRLWEAQRRQKPNLYGAQVLTLAWRWCDDRIAAHVPTGDSDALDDLVLKKVVFRTGWEEPATYACLNYRDEGDYGRTARAYLRTNLAVSAEKMHHGHADEGSFSLLTHNGTLLLHESGYRENPPDGMYRADFYHNRLLWRPGALAGRPTLDALRDNGHYKPARSERLYHTRLGDAEISRVRVADETAGVAWDRSVFFVPALPAWVVVDTALALRGAPRTFGLLWWTTDILAQGPGWADTHIRAVQTWENRRDAALRILMPAVPGQNTAPVSETARRSFQDEIALAGIWSGHHEAGRSLNFVTVLWPHAFHLAPADDQVTVEVVPSEPVGQGIAVRLTYRGEERLLATLNDLGAGYLQEEVRPRYSFAQGRTVYGPLVTDAAFACARRAGGHVWAGFINGTRLDVDGATAYAGPTTAMFQEDATDRPGVPARFRWEGAI